MNGTEPAAGSMEEPDPVSDHRVLARRTIATRAAVAVLCAVLGFAGVIQVRRTAAGDTLSSARPVDLVQILDGLQRREDDLNTEIATLQGTLTRLQGSGASSAEALAEANRQAEALGILTGTVPTEGAGVRIVISDPERRVPPELLLDALARSSGTPVPRRTRSGRCGLGFNPRSAVRAVRSPWTASHLRRHTPCWPSAILRRSLRPWPFRVALSTPCGGRPAR